MAFEEDGGALPWVDGNGPTSQFYVASTDTTWFFWEGYQSITTNPIGGVTTAYQRVVECATYNHTSGVWSGNYLVGLATLTNDSHGTPSAVRDANGRVWVFYGSHAGNLQVSTSVHPDDPSVWMANGTITATATFPKAHLVGGKIYLFFASSGSTGTIEEALGLLIGTVTGTTVSWTSQQNLVEFTNNWFFPGAFITDGTHIDIESTFSTPSAGAMHNLYYFYYDTATGDVCSFGGVTCTHTASQPVLTATANASYRVVDQTGIFGDQHNEMTIDALGVTHMIYSESTLNLTAPLARKMISSNSSTTFASPQTYDTTGVPPWTEGAVVGNSTNGVDVWYSDGSGNLWETTRNSGGTFSALTEVHPVVGQRIWEPPNVVRPDTNTGFIAISEFVPDGTANGATVGNLQGYAYRNGAFIPRPGWHGPFNPSLVGGTATLNPSDKASTITLSGSNLIATANSAGPGAVRGTTSHSAGRYHECMTVNIGSTDAKRAIGFANGSFSLTAGLGKDAAGNSMALYDNGTFFFKGSGLFSNAAIAFGVGDIICLDVDLDLKNVYVEKNGVVFFNGNNGYPYPQLTLQPNDISGIASGPYFPAVELDTSGDQVTVNLGANGYAYSALVQGDVGFGNW